jgi:ABC-type multidrug transport system fused ATPase/permease subunit
MLKHVREFWRFTKLFGIHNRLQMSFLVFGGILMSFLEVLGLSALFPLLIIIMQPAGMTHSRSIAFLSHFFHVGDEEHLAMVLGLCVAVIFIAKNVFQAIYWRVEFNVLARWRIHIMMRLYNLYMNSDYEIFMKRNSAVLMNMVAGMVPGVMTGFIHPMLNLANYLLTGAVVLAFIIRVNWLVSVIVFIAGVALLKGYSLVVRARTVRLGNEAVILRTRQFELLQQSLAGYKETRGHLKELFFSNRFVNTANELNRTEERLYFISTLPPVVVELVLMVLLIVVFEVIIYTGGDVRSATAQIGMMFLATLRLIPTINRSIAAIATINATEGTLQELLREADIYDIGQAMRADDTSFQPAGDDIPALPFTSELRMENLSYRYPGAENPALSNIGFTIRPGEFIGISGPSGGGKSTLINILLGFLTRFDGVYEVDGTAITPANIRNLRKIVGFVDQQIFMMDASLAENVAYGVEPAAIDRARVLECLTKAQLGDFVSDLPQGIDTPAGENGKLLSGGQRQRLAIARALYRNLKLLILDEASAALDVETEHRLFAFLETLKGDLAIVMIAHRLSTLQNCDRLLFLEQGRIVSSGSFASLYASNDLFRNYVNYLKIHVGDEAA